MGRVTESKTINGTPWLRVLDARGQRGVNFVLGGALVCGSSERLEKGMGTDRGETEASERRTSELMSLLETEDERVLHSVSELTLELDGIKTAVFTTDSSPQNVYLPRGTRSVTFRDELGTIRAFALVEDADFEGRAYDKGRLQISLKQSPEGVVKLSFSAQKERASIAVEGAEHVAATGEIVPLMFGASGPPRIDKHGTFRLKGYCSPDYAGQRLRLVVRNFVDVEVTASANGAITVVKELPNRPRSGEVEPSIITLFALDNRELGKRDSDESVDPDRVTDQHFKKSGT